MVASMLAACGTTSGDSNQPTGPSFMVVSTDWVCTQKVTAEAIPRRSADSTDPMRDVQRTWRLQESGRAGFRRRALLDAGRERPAVSGLHRGYRADGNRRRF